MTETNDTRPFRRGPTTLDITSCVVKQCIDANTLTYIQRLVCKWFKITAEKKYWYTLEIKTDTSNYIRIKDVVIGNDHNKWTVTDVDLDFNIKIKNIEPMVLNTTYKTISVIYSVCGNFSK